jgi:hypothetical protein
MKIQTASDETSTMNGTEQYRKEVGMMNLEKLIDAREKISKRSFPIPDKELLSRFEQLYTGAVMTYFANFACSNRPCQGISNR